MWNGNNVSGQDALGEFFESLPSSEFQVHTLDCQPVHGRWILYIWHRYRASCFHLLSWSLFLLLSDLYHNSVLVLNSVAFFGQVSNIKKTPNLVVWVELEIMLIVYWSNVVVTWSRHHFDKNPSYNHFFLGQYSRVVSDDNSITYSRLRLADFCLFMEKYMQSKMSIRSQHSYLLLFYSFYCLH